MLGFDEVISALKSRRGRTAKRKLSPVIPATTPDAVPDNATASESDHLEGLAPAPTTLPDAELDISAVDAVEDAVVEATQDHHVDHVALAHDIDPSPMDKATEIQVKHLNRFVVEAMYTASLREVTDDEIIIMFDFVEKAAYSDLPALDLTLATIDIDRLAPEIAVGIPRALYPLRGKMTNLWPFVERARSSLAARGLDMSELLQGLDARSLSCGSSQT